MIIKGGAMIKRLFPFFVAVLLGGVLFLGCSDDGTNSNLTEGDQNDPDFIQAQELANTYVDSMFVSFDQVFGYMTFDGTEPLDATADSVNINYDTETCWWEIYVSSDTTDFSMLFIDSVKFDDGTGCQMFPDSLTTTQIEYRAFFDISTMADSGSLSLTAHENVLVEGIQADHVVINASNTTFMDLVLGVYSISANYEASITDLTFNRADFDTEGPVYPLSGSAAVAMVVQGSYDQGGGARSWVVYVTFYEDHYHARAESGDNYWEWDVYYEQGPI
jgi:hypothetical protein